MRSTAFLPVLLVFFCAAGCGFRSQRDPKASTAPTNKPAPPALVSGPAAPKEPVENPLYKSWSRFKKGASIVHRSVTEAGGHETVTTTTYVLIDRTDDQVVIQMQAFTKRYDGVEFNNPPEEFRNSRWVALPSGVNRSDFGKPAVAEQGEETVSVGGKEYRTKWSKGRDRNEAGEVLVTTWTSDEVPGGLVKSITRTPSVGKTTTLELVEVKTP